MEYIYALHDDPSGINIFAHDNGTCTVSTWSRHVGLFPDLATATERALDYLRAEGRDKAYMRRVSRLEGWRCAVVVETPA